MGIFGGSKTTVPATGFYALPSDLRSQYEQFWQNIPGATAAQNFMLPDYNQDQQSAFSMIRGQANPTAESIKGLLAAYMNPYQDSVISEINRQGQGANSVLQQNINAAGQLGSNRQMLGANDVDLSRMNQIGGFLTNQFNNSLNTGLNQQQLGIQNLLGIGNQQQQQTYNNQLAPLQGLQAQQGLLQPTVQYVGASTPQQTIKTGGGLGGILGGLSSIGQIGNGLFGSGGFFSPSNIATASSFFSDRRLKENIKLVGEEKGYKLYEFSYKDDPEHHRYVGVMSDEVKEIDPDAVVEDAFGFEQVNYSKLGIKFREADNGAA